MQVVKKLTASPVFQPFSLMITFESQDEENLWHSLMARSLIVPAHLRDLGWITSGESTQLSDMMNSLAHTAYSLGGSTI